jgi:hypothetical protein
MKKLRTDHKILLAALKYPTAGLRHPDIDRAEMEICGKIRPPASWIPADAADIEWVRQLGVPTELIKVFEDGWPNESAEIGPWARLSDLRSAREDMEKYPNPWKEGFFLIGSALNGDWIVIDLRVNPGTVGYLPMPDVVCNHSNIRSKFLVVSASLGAFAMAVVKDAVPIDSYATWSDENENASWFDDIEPEENE